MAIAPFCVAGYINVGCDWFLPLHIHSYPFPLSPYFLHILFMLTKVLNLIIVATTVVVVAVLYAIVGYVSVLVNFCPYGFWFCFVFIVCIILF